MNNIELSEKELLDLLNHFYSYFETGYDFEDFLRLYLERIGLDEVFVTQRSRDGGFDLTAKRYGVEDFDDADEIDYRIQAKRNEPNTSISVTKIRELKGSLLSGQKGIFITTAKFSPDAISEAKTDFHTWLSNFSYSIADFGYYIDFNKVYKNVDSIKIELNILNSLIGSKNIETDFENLISKYPETLKCIPILLAVRESEIFAGENGEVKLYTFDKNVNTIDEYKLFMKKTGLFDLLSNHIINNLYDYVTGVETGLDSNGRKNRGGHQMEDLVESYIQKAGFKRDENYFKEMYVSEVSRKWNIDLSAVSNQGKMEKRWDFVVKTDNCIYLIETNFYGSGGSKLNETARSYKTIATEMKNVKGAKFVWFTDGAGWKSAARNLEETFDVLEDIYCISDMQNGIMKEVFK